MIADRQIDAVVTADAEAGFQQLPSFGDITSTPGTYEQPSKAIERVRLDGKGAYGEKEERNVRDYRGLHGT